MGCTLQSTAAAFSGLCSMLADTGGGVRDNPHQYCALAGVKSSLPLPADLRWSCLKYKSSMIATVLKLSSFIYRFYIYGFIDPWKCCLNQEIHLGNVHVYRYYI